jgi:hypothetical protein
MSRASRPPRRPSVAPTSRSFRSTLYPWIASALVVVAIAVLVVVRLAQDPSAGHASVFVEAPASVVRELTDIPAAVYDKVGVRSPVISVRGPSPVAGEQPLTAPGSAGRRVPEVFYLGAEYCPFCAVERWALIAALSRFGTFHDLGLMSSASTDFYPNTPTFSFLRASYTSPYLAFRPVERWSNVPSPHGGYRSLVAPTAAEASLVDRFDSPRFVGVATGTIPFVDIANRFLISGSCFSPSFLAGLSQREIAAHLVDPNDPITEAIVASANEITAAVCTTTGGMPGGVCNSPGVRSAA